MAHRLKDREGRCCGCEQVLVRCKCSAPCPGISCRVRGGLASLIGYPEYTAVSVPPRLYRRRTLSGSLVRQAYPSWSTDCDEDPVCIRTRSCSGECGWTPEGVAYEAGIQQITGACPDNSTGAVCGIGSGNAGLGDVRVLERTRARILNDGACYSSADGVARALISSLQEELDQEDTDAAAIQRLLAGSGGVWGAYAGACVGASNCCSAFWQPRGPGQVSFAYQEAEVALGGGGLTPGAAMTAVVVFYRAPWGTSAFEFFGASEVGFFVQPDGTLSPVTVQVPNAQGWVTVARGCGLREGLPA